MRGPIAIPPKTLQRLGDMLQAFNALNAQINAVDQTLREALNVPSDYELNDLRIGFEPPAEAAGADGLPSIPE